MPGARQDLKARQQRTLEAWVNNPLSSYPDIAKIAGIDVTTFWRYRQDPDFMEKYHEMCKNRFNSFEAAAMEQLKFHLDAGNWQAVKYILDSLGYKPTDKVKANIDTALNLHIGVTDD